MSNDDVRIPAGWYPDPLGLPQLRWWDNHSWTEHTSDARQPVIPETVTVQPRRAARPAAASGPLLAYADDLPFADDLADFDDLTLAPDLVEPSPTELPSRRTLREAERLAHDDDVVRDLAGDSARFGEPLGALEAPARAGDAVEADSPAMRYARAARIDDAPRSMRYDLDERHEDLLGEASIPRSAFAHASSSTRTLIPDFPEEQHAPEAVAEETTERVVRTRHAALTHAPQTTTVPAWLLTLLPIYMLLVGMMVLLGGTDASFAPVTVALVVGVPWVAGIVVAFIDHRMLRRGGMDRPAHWLWAVLGAPVYLIARLVSTVREAGTGFGPVLTYLVLALVMAGAVLAVPGLAMELAPAAFSAEAERSVADDGRSLGADLTIDCPETPPLLVQQSFFCTATDAGGESFQVLVSLQRSNGWIDWRVDDWGIFSM
ncbi:DUF2510 domain-containing protein [Pseudolysinimonas sp.]|uniref:DUF2510 domain-containing protein n=1 Tax=Pseudolysinimonas sp. TaxID=2680009 RepID=UPI0037853215